MFLNKHIVWKHFFLWNKDSFFTSIQKKKTYLNFLSRLLWKWKNIDLKKQLTHYGVKFLKNVVNLIRILKIGKIKNDISFWSFYLYIYE